MSVRLTDETMKVYMEKRKFVQKLSALFEEGSLLDVQKMEYAPVLDGEMEVISEKVTVTFRNGLRTEIDVTADSTLAIMRDVLRRLLR